MKLMKVTIPITNPDHLHPMLGLFVSFGCASMEGCKNCLGVWTRDRRRRL